MVVVGSWSNVGKDIGGFWRGLSITLNDSYIVEVESRKTSEIHSEFIPASFFDISRKRHKTSFRRETNPIMARKKENRHDVLVHCHQGLIEYPNEDSRLGGLRANRYTAGAALDMVNCVMIFLVPIYTYLYLPTLL